MGRKRLDKDPKGVCIEKQRKAENAWSRGVKLTLNDNNRWRWTLSHKFLASPFNVLNKYLQFKKQHPSLYHTTHTYLMHGERLHLSLQNLHPCCCHHGADVWHNGIGEYFINQAMVSKVTSICHMLHWIAIILVCNRSTLHISRFLSQVDLALPFMVTDRRKSIGSAVTFFILCRLDVYTPICRLPRTSRWPFMGLPIFCSCLG